MALCGKCGNDPINGIKDNDAGNCGKCQADDWLELNDLIGSSGHVFWMSEIKDYMEQTNSKSIGHLIYKIFKSQGWNDERDIVHKIFEYGVLVKWKK